MSNRRTRESEKKDENEVLDSDVNGVVVPDRDEPVVVDNVDDVDDNGVIVADSGVFDPTTGAVQDEERVKQEAEASAKAAEEAFGPPEVQQLQGKRSAFADRFNDGLLAGSLEQFHTGRLTSHDQHGPDENPEG